MIELQSIEAEVDYVIGDMADPATVQASLEGCNACIHAAAFTSLDPSQMDQALAVNGPAAQLILDTAHQQGCDPIIHISTMSVIFPPSGDLLSGEDPVHGGGNPYNAPKSIAEVHAISIQAD